MTSMKKRSLGKGLSDLGIGELLSDLQTIQNQPTTQWVDSLRHLPIARIQPGKYQPRKTMNPDTLQELADSIKGQGVIQPIIVRSIAENNYEIIAGERRWRAAQLAGLGEIPAVIRDISDAAAFAVALIENIQREDLNPIEEAVALQNLIDEFDLTHEEVADTIGKARVTVTNLLRILQLNQEVKTMIAERELELGHGKVLLSVPIELQHKLAQTISAKKLSVRETEALVHKLQIGKTRSVRQLSDNDDGSDLTIASLQTELSGKLGTPVKIDYRNGKGKLVIQYQGVEQLKDILLRIN